MVEPPPTALTDIFGHEAGRVSAFADLLVSVGAERGLIGPREPGRIWSRHILNSWALSSLLDRGARVADIGSGAGLPGMVLALGRADLRLTLIEPMARRCLFLAECIERLELSNVEVIRARAEELRELAPGFDAAVSRAVAPLDKLLSWSLPLVRPGGTVLALKGESAWSELAAAQALLASFAVAEAGLFCQLSRYGRVGATVVRVQAGSGVPVAGDASAQERGRPSASRRSRGQGRRH